MKDVSDSPHAFGDAARPAARAASGPRTAALLKRGRDTVVAIASPGRIGLTHTLTPEQRLLMRVVNGRLSAARVARLAGLSEEVAMESLAALCGEGLLKTVDPVEMAVSAQHGTRMFKFGPYDVVAQVGEGGMGSVFVCRRTGAAGFQRLFALKLVSAASRQPAAAAQSFAREVAVGRLLT